MVIVIKYNFFMDILYIRRFLLFVLILGGLLFSLVACFVLYERERFSATRVVIFDVGQGDAILLSEGSQQILIDGGPDGRVLLEELGRQMPFWDDTIEVVIATHPDSDHIDGLVDLVQSYHVTNFFATDIEKDTSVYAALVRNLRNRDIEIQEIERGFQFTFDSGSSFEIIYPFAQDDVQRLTGESNNASISGVFSVRAIADSEIRERFFLGGDLHSEIEDLLPLDDSITVLKAGHHGSGTSTSLGFLERLTPRDVIFSAGLGNRYNHPKDTIVKRVEDFGATIYRTDTQGSIVYECRDQCVVSFDK